jgi:hypothetical protein
MDEQSKTQLDKVYREKKKVITYSGKEVREITGISLRTFRYRMEELKKQFEGVGNLLELKKNKWVIHQDLVHHFFRKTNKKKVSSVYQINWKSFITWVPASNFPKEYHTHLIREVMKSFPNGLFLPVIEQTENGVNHVHMISNEDAATIESEIVKILKDYWHFWEYRLEVDSIKDIVLTVNYVLKDELAVKSIIKNEELITKILNRYENEKF